MVRRGLLKRFRWRWVVDGRHLHVCPLDEIEDDEYPWNTIVERTVRYVDPQTFEISGLPEMGGVFQNHRHRVSITYPLVAAWHVEVFGY